MKECVLHIQLIYRSVLGCVNAHNHTNHSRFDNMTKGVIEIKIGKFRESLSNKTTFRAFNIALTVKLILIKPSTTSNVGMRWRGDKIPGVIRLKSRYLRVHDYFLVGITNGLSSGARDMRDVRSGRQVK